MRLPVQLCHVVRRQLQAPTPSGCLPPSPRRSTGAPHHGATPRRREGRATRLTSASARLAAPPSAPAYTPPAEVWASARSRGAVSRAALTPRCTPTPFGVPYSGTPSRRAARSAPALRPCHRPSRSSLGRPLGTRLPVLRQLSPASMDWQATGPMMACASAPIRRRTAWPAPRARPKPPPARERQHGARSLRFLRRTQGAVGRGAR
jgi:hypothetical protein